MRRTAVCVVGFPVDGVMICWLCIDWTNRRSAIATVRVSSKYQIVIPREAREALDIRPGQEFAVLVKGRSVSLVPVPTLEELRGVLNGADLSDLREKVDHL